MKTNLRFVLSRGLALALFASGSALCSKASDSTPSVSRATSLTGEVPVTSVGPYIHVGSYRIWVTSHLGRPDIALADGTLVYKHRQAEDGDVSGTLVIAFAHGRVMHMNLVGPAQEMAVLARSQRNVVIK